VALALFAAGLVATLPAVVAGPFLSAARSATLHHQMDAACGQAVGLTVTSSLNFTKPDFDPPSYVPARQLYNARLAEMDTVHVSGLGAGSSTLVATVPIRPSDGIPVRGSLVYRPGAKEHVEVLSGPVGSGGAWISNEYAQLSGLKIGDSVPVRLTYPVKVTAIYRDLRELPDQPFWCDLHDLYRGPPGAEFSDSGVPSVVLLDQDTFLDAGEATGLTAQQTFHLPLLDPHPSIDAAHATRAGMLALRNSLHDTAPGNPFGTPDYLTTTVTVVTSALLDDIAHADLAYSSLMSTVLPISATGLLVGLLVVGAASVFWVQRRRQELALLAAHGVGAAALGGKAVAEALPALVLGCLAGWGTGWTLLAAIGPDPVLSREAAPLAAAGAGVAVLVSLLTVGMVAGLRCRGLTDQHAAGGRRRGAMAPWELLLLAAVPVVWWLLPGSASTGSSPADSGIVVHIPARLLVVPILTVIGCAAVAVRLAAAWVRGPGRRRYPKSAAVYLGWRRVGRDAVISAVLAGATAIPVALTGYGATVNDSVRSTLAGQAGLALGSDVVITLTEPVPVPAAFGKDATEVYRIDATLFGDYQTDVLAVDPDGFARDAYWTGALGRPLRDLLAPLRGSGGPAAVATPPLTAGATKVTYTGATLFDRLTVTAVPILPARYGGYPVAIVRMDQLPKAEFFKVPQLWIRGDPDRIKAIAAGAHLPIATIRVARDSYADTIIEPLTYTFDYLGALCLLTGVVTLVGLLLYLESRAPKLRRGYVLLRRMGLAARSHRRALLVELSVPLAAGLVVGALLVVGLGYVLAPSFRVNTIVPPGTILELPLHLGALIALGVAAVALAATGYAQWRIGRARPSEVLRDVA
jgi:putative ABC transport system permease protein